MINRVQIITMRNTQYHKSKKNNWKVRLVELFYKKIEYLTTQLIMHQTLN